MLQAKSQQSRIWIGIAAAALGSMALIGCGGGGDDTNPGKVQGGASGGSAGGPGGSGGSVSLGGGMGGGGQTAAMPGAAPSKQQVASDKPKNTSLPFAARNDPFKPWFNTIPPPPNVLTLTEPVRIAMTGTTAPEVQPGVEIQEVPSRRVAGILNGNGVYALLDGGPAGPEVVKPGQLLDDGYRVTMINSNSVTLQKKVKTQTYTQVVPLTDAGSSASVGMGGGGFRSGPGMGVPGFGRPGGPGGKGGLSPGGAGGGAGAD